MREPLEPLEPLPPATSQGFAMGLSRSFLEPSPHDAVGRTILPRAKKGESVVGFEILGQLEDPHFQPVLATQRKNLKIFGIYVNHSESIIYKIEIFYLLLLR